MNNCESIRTRAYNRILAIRELRAHETTFLVYFDAIFDLSHSVESIIMSAPYAFNDFLKLVEKYRTDIISRFHGNIPIAYLYENYLFKGSILCA